MIKRLLILSGLLVVMLCSSACPRNTAGNALYLSTQGSLGYERTIHEHLRLGVEVNTITIVHYSEDEGTIFELWSRNYSPMVVFPRVRIPVKIYSIETSFLPLVSVAIGSRIRVSNVNFGVETMYTHNLSNSFVFGAGFRIVNMDWWEYDNSYYIELLQYPIFRATVFF